MVPVRLEIEMSMRWIALLGMAVLLSGCAQGPAGVQAGAQPWNDGTWNSVLGYNGPSNAMVTGGPASATGR
jgi:hypothetical protein